MPFDYSLCCQTATVYRNTPGGVVRQVLQNCFLQWLEEERFDLTGRRVERKFLLIQPGEEQRVFAGDRVYEGIGPQVTAVDWDTFVPELVAGLGQVAYAAPYRWQGIFCHTEAGRK